MSRARIHPRCKSRNGCGQHHAVAAEPPIFSRWETRRRRGQEVLTRSPRGQSFPALYRLLCGAPDNRRAWCNRRRSKDPRARFGEVSEAEGCLTEGQRFLIARYPACPTNAHWRLHSNWIESTQRLRERGPVRRELLLRLRAKLPARVHTIRDKGFGAR